MCDCDVWERTIAELTGKTMNHYDPKSQFAATWAKLHRNFPS